ncbi:MAG: hypothetical protein L0H53_08710 [Candidatus Nitrosocosmicus sp.]|nr:hypothetical protein [Candidatus Nitrosocosmicus sp.]MDN5868853.1 hypothetical protein [Candidatus Nitrosocosmicus sp.]
MAGFKSISELKKLVAAGCKIDKVEPPVYGSDIETVVVRVSIKCPDGKVYTIKAYKEESSALREFIRTNKLEELT